jgi:sulfate adenylyltransferase subunit 2
VFPISNWTELDVWNYIKQENLVIPSIYYAHKREVFVRNGLLIPNSEYITLSEDEEVFEEMVRFRTVGDKTCTAAVPSYATELDTIIGEISGSTISERGARIDDQRSEAAMEERKKVGYF